ncbi:MAG: S8 family serine peptidase, partial [Methanosarcinaceae archaeon]|nr:S8 family serine peptidase [Methanosarcinaceae archaeon]
FIYLSVFQTSAENLSVNQALGTENYTIHSGPAFEAPDLRKPEFSEVQKKLSSDLLQLTNSSFLPPGSSRTELVKQMEGLEQIKYTTKNPDFRENGKRIGKIGKSEPETKETQTLKTELVHVYIRFYPGSDPKSAKVYMENITGQAEELYAAWVKIDALEALASLKTVQNIRTVLPPFRRTGPYLTEGDAIHNCAEVREKYGLTGKGIKIGILSNGVDNLNSAVANKDLPANLSVLRNTQGGDEGTAMLEIVHDIAPGAELYFHDSGNNVLAFNAAIDALVAAGCDIICDDIGWITEPFFEDGIVAAHVQQVIEKEGILYVSSAGNDALNHYQGEFYPSESNFHDFSEGKSDLKALYINLPPEGSLFVVLQWNDKWGQSSNDYNLYLWDLKSEELLAVSNSVQDGEGEPVEFLLYGNMKETATDVAVLVNKYAGEARLLEVYLYPLRALSYSENLKAEDSIFGHPAALGAVSVGAIEASDPRNDQIEPYSSIGPVSIFYPAYELRKKPEISGIDGVQVSGAGGFPSPFYGTSASAPHVAALAGLVWSAKPEKSGSEIRAALLKTAKDRGALGYDTIFGYGLADALAMYKELEASPLPLANFSANQTEGPAPLNVIFTDLSENATSWQWDVDSDFLIDYTLQNPVHTYPEPGLYTVSLTVKNKEGSDTLVKTDYINVSWEAEAWNPWNDPNSEEGETVTTLELQEAINCWIKEKPAPKTGAKITKERLQELLNAWLKA